MVKRKKMILKAIIMCLMPALLFSLFVGKTYAYHLDSEGNVQSENLLDIYNSYTGSSHVIVNNDTISFGVGGSIAIELWDTLDDYTSLPMIFWTEGQMGGSFTKTATTNYLRFKPENNVNYDLWYDISGLENGQAYYLSSIMSNSSSSTTLSDIMLNKGSTRLDYEPYGTWFAPTNNPAIYYLMNNATVELYSTGSNNGNYIFVMTESYNYVEGNLIDYSGIPNIYQYIRSHEDYYFRIKVKLNQPTNKIINFTFADASTMEYYAVLSNSLNGQSFTFERTSASFTLTCDTSSHYYDTIILSQLYSPDYVRFNMFISDDSYSYSNGYDNGYREGHSDGQSEGYQSGYDAGKNYGYRNGFNDGAETNLETNGMKTLFNSILSFPVNMIRSVFNFEFMGVNVAGVVLFIISIGIVAFVIKKFL